MSIEHVDAPAGEIHVWANWVVADSTARLALTVAAGDVGKVAWQQDDDSFWLLTDDSPMTWEQVGGPHASTHESGGSDEIDVTGLSGLLADPQTPDTHTHSSSDITDFAEAVEDKIGAKVVAGTGISVSYNDGTGETTITNSDPGAGVAVTDEHIQDVVGALLADGDVDFTYDDAGNTVTNIVTKASKSFALSGDLSPSQITSDQNDYSPTNLADNAILRLDTDSNSGAGRSLTGLAGGADGRIITIINVGSNALRLKAENASSSAANRFAFAIDLVLGSKRSAVLWYDSTSSRWRLLSTTAVPLRHTVAISDETTALTTGTAKLTFRFATAVYLLQVRANLNTVSSSGAPAFDVNEAGASIFSTTLTIDASEKSSETAATPAVISDPNIADDAEITIDIDTAGTGAKGAKLTFIGWEI